MPLSAGSKLGAYEITDQIGAGGMGEVYRAHDTSLDRDVAIKVLPEAFATDTERLARFEREAKVLASLNHPNIAAIYGLETSGETRALILELVEGPTLQERIAEGAVSLDDTLPIARQIADALEAAHEQGIVHRDLKPANVKVRDDGTVKVLDFGLAKALEPEGTETDAANSPTVTMTAAATRAGVVMGTAAYMAPEQAKGRKVDKRADIWAFGVLLYEMLTGRQAFGGTDISETLAAVLKTDLDLDALPAGTPAGVRRVIARCLQKDRARRSRDIGDVKLDLEEAEGVAGSQAQVGEVGAAAPLAFWQRPAIAAVIALTLIAATGLSISTLTRPAPPSITRTSIVLPAPQRITSGEGSLAISPMGSHVVYVANSQLYLRSLAELQAQPLAGTEGSEPRAPFFSPDGRWVAFFSDADGRLKRVPLEGGAAVSLAEAPDGTGGSWGEDDTIVFSQGRRSGTPRVVDSAIFRVAGTGGTPETLVTLESGDFARRPQLLPGGEALLYTFSPGFNNWENSRIVVEQLTTGERTVVAERGGDARYLPSGHLVFTLDGSVLAAPFDADRLEMTDGAVSLVDDVRVSRRSGAMDADVAATGTLVYLPQGAGDGAVDRTFVWVDRVGAEEPLSAPPKPYGFPRISPDGRRVSVNADGDIWIWDFVRETLTRLTFVELAGFSVWTPDNERIVFEARGSGEANLHWVAANGTGEPEVLYDSPLRQAPHTISPDGSRLVFYEIGSGTSFDLYSMTLDSDRRIEPLIVTEFAERNAEISPDGRWMAYQSDASGRWEVYVQPFPDLDQGRWQISSNGGNRPLWSPDGSELFYMTNEGVMGVTVESTDSAFQPGPQRLLFSGPYSGIVGNAGANRTYDISPDGQRFLMLRESARDADDPYAGLTRIHVVQNWFEELNARVPVP